MEIKHVYGNPIEIAIPLTQKVRTLDDGQEVETTSDFYPSSAVTVTLRNAIATYTFTATMEGNVAIIVDEKGSMKNGTYSLVVTCNDQQGNPRRFAMKEAVKIVNYTAEAGIEAGIEFDAETYTLEGVVFFYAKGDKGDQGDPFTYEDFTPEQILELQKPALDAAHLVDETLSNYIGDPISDITVIL